MGHLFAAQDLKTVALVALGVLFAGAALNLLRDTAPARFAADGFNL